jgi:hypothetical protein
MLVYIYIYIFTNRQSYPCLTIFFLGKKKQNQSLWFISIKGASKQYHSTCSPSVRRNYTHNKNPTTPCSLSLGNKKLEHG